MFRVKKYRLQKIGDWYVADCSQCRYQTWLGKKWAVRRLMKRHVRRIHG